MHQELQDANLEPIDDNQVFTGDSEEQTQQYAATGLELIKAGDVTCVILAGGSGSRLGFEHPKGMYDIGLPSRKSIFQILTERFLRVQMLAHGQENLMDTTQFKCKLLIMTSGNNHDETVTFFQQHSFFGAQPDQIIFFKQASLPAIDVNGKILMKSKHEVNLAPNGNGALFEAINTNNMIKRHIKSTKMVQVIGVDNVLNKIMDPVQVGFTQAHGHQATLKCVKRRADEKVGVVCIKNGKYDIVEYSELTPLQAALTRSAEDHRLMFELGSILVFMLSSSKLLQLCASTAQLNKLYHKAFKKLEFFHKEQNQTVKPDKENAYKFELFLHNFLPFCDDGKFGVLCVQRHDEFAPVKNADEEGKVVADSPTQAREFFRDQHRRWLS